MNPSSGAPAPEGNNNNNNNNNNNSLVDPDLQKGERKARKQQTKAERKKARQQDEIAEANKVRAVNESINKAIDYIAILDFEATCDDKVKLDVQEIIEFPTVFVSTQTGQIEHVFHTYVKPDVNPTLTPFCTELTGIEQATVDGGLSLVDAFQSQQEYLDRNGLVSAFADDKEKENSSGKQKTFVYATCGDWDLRTCLPQQMEQHLGQTCPRHFCGWCNLKFAFRDFYKIKPKGMTDMLNHVNLDLEGRHHSGIDDCKNLARIVEIMLNDGWEPEGITGTTLR